jgi:hypothetical protein
MIDAKLSEHLKEEGEAAKQARAAGRSKIVGVVEADTCMWEKMGRTLDNIDKRIEESNKQLEILNKQMDEMLFETPKVGT